MKKITQFWRNALLTILSLCFLLAGIAGIFIFYLASDLPKIDSLKTVHLQTPLRIYTQEGLLIQEFGEKRRIPISYQEIPPTLVKAILVTEDQRFFTHSGVDIFGLGRAVIHMIQTGTKAQGGSTITMQVARNFFLSRKKTFLRKFKEILLAIKIDRELTKEKILELYLNKIYLGNRAYGVAAAAEVYYGKNLKELSLAEQATIAGLPQAPSTQNPIANPIAAKNRRNHVLERLFEEKYISKEQLDEAVAEPITAKYHSTTIEVHAPYISEMIRQSLYENFGADAYTKGYKVYTTIKANLQTAANKAVMSNLLNYDQRHGYRGPVAKITDFGIEPSPNFYHKLLAPFPSINNLEPAVVLMVAEKDALATNRFGQNLTIPWSGMEWAVKNKATSAKQILTQGDIVYLHNYKNQWYLTQIPQVEAALVALNPKNGAISALVGGFNFQRSKFNRAIQSQRQPGSSFKPFIYAAALNKGYTLATIINDSPVVIDDPTQANFWRPQNDNLKFNGPTRLKDALIHSRNLVSIRILDDLGFDYVIDFLTRFGFRKESLPKALSLALGTLTVTPLEQTAAFAVFANGGYKIEPYLIDHITDLNGNILLESKQTVVCNNNCDLDKTDVANLAPRVLPRDVTFLMNTALQDVIKLGTGKSAKVFNRTDLAGKTGTTNDQVDAWFVGFNQDIVATTWVGFDSPQSLHESAAKVALPLWIDFMKTALYGTKEKKLEQPENIITSCIDPNTGLLAKSNQKNSIKEYFRAYEAPGDESESIDEAESIDTNTSSNSIGSHESSLF